VPFVPKAAENTYTIIATNNRKRGRESFLKTTPDPFSSAFLRVAPNVSLLIEFDATIMTDHPYPDTPASVVDQVMAEVAADRDTVLATKAQVIADTAQLLVDFAADKALEANELEDARNDVAVAVAHALTDLSDALAEDINQANTDLDAKADTAAAELTILQTLVNSSESTIQAIRAQVKQDRQDAFGETAAMVAGVAASVAAADSDIVEQKSLAEEESTQKRQQRETDWGNAEKTSIVEEVKSLPLQTIRLPEYTFLAQQAEERLNQLRERLRQVVRDSSSVQELHAADEEVVRTFARVYDRVVGMLTEPARRALAEELNGVELFPNRRALMQAYRERTGRNAPGAHAFADLTTGHLWAPADLAELAGEEHYLHEFGHLIDRRVRDDSGQLVQPPRTRYSSMPEWRRIWRDELAGNDVAREEYRQADFNSMTDEEIVQLRQRAFPLCENANESAQEGFADFFVLGMRNAEDARRRFPQAWRFMVRIGLVEEPQGDNND